MIKKYTDAELADRLQSPGWSLVTESKDPDGKIVGTLEEMAKATHERQTKGEAPGLIQELVTTVEVDMIQIELLWNRLGLPV
jgi:hypothetical protein